MLLLHPLVALLTVLSSLPPFCFEFWNLINASWHSAKLKALSYLFTKGIDLNISFSLLELRPLLFLGGCYCFMLEREREDLFELRLHVPDRRL